MSREKEVKMLCDLRSKIAFAAKGSHSWSFSDEELIRLVKAHPTTLDELGVIKGFPRKGKRVSAYGQEIIDIFNGKEFTDFEVKMTNESTLEVRGLIKPLSTF